MRRSGSSLELLINGTNDKLTVSNYFEPSGKYVVESVQFADGTVWDSAFIGTHLSTSPANGTGLTLSGTSNNDQLTGGADGGCDQRRGWR
ncbi:calcium-binding protein [Paenibacillus sp. FSL R5-0912]|uniref:calcium-binding protein n=1 Tax=Paenibacillus sp. FSL R5-0912 TaxID=1536771 RepID=UPI0030EBEC15